MITNCSAERSFSQLKRIKNSLRTNTTQIRLNALTLLCMETAILRQIDFDDLIHTFANQKARKKLF